MGVSYYAATWLTGEMYARELPLTEVKGSSRLSLRQPGTFSANLNLHSLIDPDSPLSYWEQVADLYQLLRAGRFSIVPARGSEAATVTVGTPIGEWWINDVGRQHYSPIVELSGVEYPGYCAENVVAKKWRDRKTDVVKTCRQMLADLANYNQTQYISFPLAESAILGEVDVKAGSVSVLDAVRELQGDGFEWTLELGMTGYVVTRKWVWGAPKLRTPRLDTVLELTTEGGDSASVLDLREDEATAQECHNLFAFGGGAGASQPMVEVAKPRQGDMPQLSRTVTASDVQTKAQLGREAARAMADLSPSKLPLRVAASPDRLPADGPQLGDVYTWIKEPSMSMPWGEKGQVRVVGWDWQPAATGQPELYTLELEREV